MTTSTTLVLCAPDRLGSEPGLDGFVDALAERLNGIRVIAHNPAEDGTLTQTLNRLAEDGADKIVCLPVTPFLADRMKADLPTRINAATTSHPDVSITLARAPDIEPALLRAAQARLDDTLAETSGELALTETVLLVAGPGAEDAEANAGVAKMARMIWEGMGFAWCETGFAEIAAPTIGDALSKASLLGYRRIVVLPYELAAAGTEAAARTACADHASRTPGIDFVWASRLGTHPAVIETLAARVEEALGGGVTNAMNCQICSYREQVLASEEGDGGHHHHQHHDDDPAATGPERGDD